MKTVCGLAIVLLALLPGCGGEEKARKVDLSKREHVKLAGESDVVTYAFLPQYAHTVAYQRHRLLIEYLRRTTGLNIRQLFPGTFDEHLRMVAEGTIDVSYVNPFVYVKLADRYGASAFARAVEVYGKKDFRGQIICRADNKAIQSVADCRGKTWIAVDPSSAGGFLYPLGFFAEHGLFRRDFAAIDFAPGPGGKQEKVVLAVYAGKYEIGSIREGTLNVVANKIDISQIRVLAHTDWYPGWLFAARKGLDPSTTAIIREAICGLDYDNSQDRPILEAADFYGVIAAEDRDFDSVRRLVKSLGIDANL
jgi:phosphonate transport system substrate-binding protein